MDRRLDGLNAVVGRPVWDAAGLAKLSAVSLRQAIHGCCVAAVDASLFSDGRDLDIALARLEEIAEEMLRRLSATERRPRGRPKKETP